MRAGKKVRADGCGSQQASLAERTELVILIADDDVIEELDIHEGCGLSESGGDGDVFVAGFRVARGVIVNDDEIDGGVSNGGEKDFAGRDEIGGESTDGNNFIVYNGVAGVEVEAAELFFAERSHVAGVLIDVERRADEVGGGVRFLRLEEASAELEAGNKDAGFVVRQGGFALEGGDVTDIAEAEGTVFFEDALGELFDGFGAGTGGEDDREELGEREGVGAVLREFFAESGLRFVRGGGEEGGVSAGRGVRHRG